MAVLPIRKYPDPILSQKTKLVKNISDPIIQELILDMLETMEANHGVGLAAPQVGYSLRLTVLRVAGETYILFNPKFKSKSWRKAVAEEGCLSFPGEFYLIKRSRKVKIKAVNQKGEPVLIKAEGFLARVLQHEIDHLDGILFIKRRVKEKAKPTDSGKK